MKITKGLIDKLIALRDGESLPASGLKGEWVDELIRDRILLSSSKGSRRSLAVVDGESFAKAVARIDERFADIQMLRYNVEGFDELSLQQKTFIYHLQEAALWGRDILFDQNGRYNLELRRMMEKLYQEYQGDRESTDFKAFEDANIGILVKTPVVML